MLWITQIVICTGNPHMVGQCKDVGSNSKCPRHEFSMGILVWKGAQILCLCVCNQGAFVDNLQDAIDRLLMGIYTFSLLFFWLIPIELIHTLYSLTLS